MTAQRSGHYGDTPQTNCLGAAGGAHAATRRMGPRAGSIAGARRSPRGARPPRLGPAGACHGRSPGRDRAPRQWPELSELPAAL